MTNAGWYPDPAGQPQTYRYWDGQRWSQETTGDPYAPAPGQGPGRAPGQPGGEPPTAVVPGGAPAPSYQPQQPQQPPSAPQPPQGYGAIAPPPSSGPGYGAGGYGGYGQQPFATPGGSGGSSGGAGKTIGIVALAILLIVGLGVGAFFIVQSVRGDDDTKADDDTSETTEESGDATDDPTEPSDPTESTDPTDTPTTPNDDTDTSVVPTTEQCTGVRPGDGKPSGGGVLKGGGLTVPIVDGYASEAIYASVFTFANDVEVAYKKIEASWISIYAVGGVPKNKGYEDPEHAVEVLTQCMTGSSQFYSGFTGRTDLEEGPITVDGHEGYSLVTEVRVETPEVQAEGDQMQVIVVETDDPGTYGLYVSQVTIGMQDLLDLQEQNVKEITVD